MKGLASLYDNFITTKTAWKDIRSGWSFGSNKATASTTNYPLRSATMSKANVEVSIKNPGSGTGAAFWITDSGNWWGLVSDQTQTYAYNYCSSGYPYSYNYTAYGQPCYSTCGGNFTGTYYNSFGYYGNYYCSGGNFTGNYYYSGIIYYGTYYCYVVKVSYVYSYTTCSRDYYSYTSPNYNAYTCNADYYSITTPNYNATFPCITSYNCNNTETANAFACTGYTNVYNYGRVMRIIRYVNNVVSEITSSTVDAVNAPIAGLKLKITGATKGSSSSGTITAQAFSDSNLVTQIGNNLIYNPTGVNITTNFGIVANPASYNQSLQIDEINIQ
jgi:hypothetical protein